MGRGNERYVWGHACSPTPNTWSVTALAFDGLRPEFVSAYLRNQPTSSLALGLLKQFTERHYLLDDLRSPPIFAVERCHLTRERIHPFACYIDFLEDAGN